MFTAMFKRDRLRNIENNRGYRFHSARVVFFNLEALELLDNSRQKEGQLCTIKST